MSAIDRKPMFLLELADRRGTFIYGSHVPVMATKDGYLSELRIFIGESGKMRRLEATDRYVDRHAWVNFQTVEGTVRYGHGLAAVWKDAHYVEHDLLIYRLEDCEIHETEEQVTFTPSEPSVPEAEFTTVVPATVVDRYLRDRGITACDVWASWVGGLGFAPGAFIGDRLSDVSPFERRSLTALLDR